MGLKLAAGLTLDNGLRPQAIAGVAPTLDYRFARDKREIETVSLVDKLAFTGGNQGTFVGSDGYIQRATTNVPRFDHDPLSRISEGLLVEGSRTNLLKNSEQFDDVSWGKFSTTITANAATGPDGYLTADLQVPANGVAGSYILQTVNITSGTTYTYSVYAKAGGFSVFRLLAQGSGFGSVGVNQVGAYDLSTGIASVISGTPTISMTSVGNGWYRCTLTTTAIATTTDGCQFRINSTGDGTSGIYIWGAQLEAGSTPSTYIPTTTTTVTRTADSATIDGTGVLTGTYTIVEKPAGCAVESSGDIVLQEDYTVERVMVFPAALSAGQITAIREAM